MTKMETLARANELAMKDLGPEGGLTKAESKEYKVLLKTIMNNDWEDEFYAM